ncbi:MAG TPA: hypothetical protein VFP97_02450 [Chitinophagaceae bacterium]|nr:hypothetical protein [Chitinophagaceae bacterium]
MAEGKNTSDESLENAPHAGLDKRPEDKVSSIDAKSVHPKQETQNMETHVPHLHRDPGKKFWHYIYEFLMLFLAVFCGFLAENQREHIVEDQREKKFARRLLSDLRQDSIFFETRIRQLEARQKAHTRFLEIMTSPIRATDSAVMRGFVPLLAGTSNDFTTATYNQMKTSGTLRYIDNDNLTTSLQKYYDVLLARASHDSEGANKFFTDYIISYMMKHFRFQDFKPSDGSVMHIKLLNRSVESDQELINLMGVWSANCDTQLDLQRPAQKQMLELINLIKKEYHLG